MADLFSTNVMMGVVASLIEPPQFLVDRFFPKVQTETSEEIHFDVISKTRRLTPFVSPLVEGKVVAGQGFYTDTFKPAYLKDKRVWDGARALKRSPGEQIGGSMDPLTRMRALLQFELQDQVDMLRRRMEVMAADVLLDGACTIVGDLYPSTSVNFGRAAANTVALAGAAKWDQAGVNPLDNLQDWALIVLQASGAMPVDVVLDVAAWKIFRENPFVKARITLQKQAQVMPTLDQGAQLGEGATFMGTIDGFNIWVYAGYYVDDNGVLQPILPARTVIMGSPQVEGVRAYGAIRDEAAGYQAVPYFPKSWVTDDPAVRYLMLQSAPLLVPTRVNATLTASV